MKKQVYKNIAYLVCIAVILGLVWGAIYKLNSQNLELRQDMLIAQSGFNTADTKFNSDIQTLQSEINELRTENAEQEEVIAAQQDIIDTYDKKFEDMTAEVKAYEAALEKEAPKMQLPTTWEGQQLTKAKGCIMGPSGRETYYNLPMGGCINNMRRRGFDEEQYPVWERDDGAKMFGKYVMVAANWKIRPLGTIIETSIGWGIVVDTGDFVSEYPYEVDIAVNW